MSDSIHVFPSNVTVCTFSLMSVYNLFFLPFVYCLTFTHKRKNLAQGDVNHIFLGDWISTRFPLVDKSKISVDIDSCLVSILLS